MCEGVKLRLTGLPTVDTQRDGGETVGRRFGAAEVEEANGPWRICCMRWRAALHRPDDDVLVVVVVGGCGIFDVALDDDETADDDWKFSQSISRVLWRRYGDDITMDATFVVCGVNKMAT